MSKLYGDNKKKVLRTCEEDPPDWDNLYLNTHGQLQPMCRSLNVLPPPKANRQQLIEIIRFKLMPKDSSYKRSYVRIPEEPDVINPQQYLSSNSGTENVSNTSIFDDTDESDQEFSMPPISSSSNQRSPSPLSLHNLSHIFPQTDSDGDYPQPNPHNTPASNRRSRSPTPIQFSPNQKKTKSSYLTNCCKNVITKQFIILFSILFFIILFCRIFFGKTSIPNDQFKDVNVSDETKEAGKLILSYYQRCVYLDSGVPLEDIIKYYPNLNIQELELIHIYVKDDKAYPDPDKFELNTLCDILRACDL